MSEQDTREQLTDSFMKYERMEGRTLIIDGAEFADTREKLEADVQKYLDLPANCRGWGDYKVVCEWLDRQAAITQRECMERATSERVGWNCAECAEGFGKELDRRCDPLKARIADLQSQLDEVSRAYKERGRRIAELVKELDQWEKLTANIDLPEYPITRFEPKDKDRLIAELTAERDHLQGVVMQQAESFRKLEAASAMPADCTECKHLDELRALRRRIRKLARFAGLLD